MRRSLSSNSRSRERCTVPTTRQLTFLEPSVASDSGAPPDWQGEYGEVFTRRWVVDFILDLVEYASERDLGAEVLVEPSCGTGAFLVPVVERLIESAVLHHRPLTSLAPAIRAFDLLPANAELARKAVVATLVDAGVDTDQAQLLAETWVVTGDFLLQDHGDLTADFVVGNPPYIRLEDVPRAVMDEYRRRCSTMRGRADIYVGFIETGLSLLKEGGRLGFICADRWMHNQYGARLRELVSDSYAVDTVIAMHDVDAFEDEVSAYPAIIVLTNGCQGEARVVDARKAFGPSDAALVGRWRTSSRTRRASRPRFQASRVPGWFEGADLWPTGSPADLAMIRDLEKRFPPLEDRTTGTRVGIGVASGCDEVFLTKNPDLVEPERLLPLVQSGDITSGEVRWSGTFLVNPWTDEGLLDLRDYPRLRRYLQRSGGRLRERHVARRRPAHWYRTIDRVDGQLLSRPKLLLPDLKAAAHPVLESGELYPHHNLYFVVSDRWDLEVLGGLLLSDVANVFVGAYCVKMRGGCYRFQAQYLRRIRVPRLEDVTTIQRRHLAKAFGERDAVAASAVARQLYGLDGHPGTRRKPFAIQGAD